jgi:hypothetical protein
VAKPNVDWCFVSNGGRTISCDRCGKSHQIDLPMSVTLYGKFLEAFTAEHQLCVRGMRKKTKPK